MSAELIEYMTTKYSPPSITCSLRGSFEGPSRFNLFRRVPTR
jgi:hypothetical protein